MADLDFTHKVNEIPTQEKLPEPYQRRVGAETAQIPDYLSAASQYGASTNWMSAIGSHVAAQASNALAKKIGIELGKNPEGDMGVPLTEFDEIMQKSYNTQASATLGLQANKLITDSNIEMSNAPRLTPELITTTNKKIGIGLQNIFKNAPTEIQAHLQFQYGNVQLSQLESLNDRMIKEQKQDDHDNTIASSNANAEHAYTLGIQGNEKGALAFIANTDSINKASLARKTINPQISKSNIDTVRISAKSGILVHDYENARSSGHGEQFLKDLADKGDKSNPDFQPTVQNLMTHIGQQNSLRNQQESLTMTEFQTDLVRGIPITGSRLAELKEDLSPINYQKTLLDYYKSLKRNTKESEEMALLNGGFEKPEVAGKARSESLNGAFAEKTRIYMDANPKVSIGEAQAHIAAQAAVPIPDFTSTINAQMRSIDPNEIESAISKMEYMYHAEKGDNLRGVDNEAKLFAESYLQARRSLPSFEAAKQTHERYFNIKSGEKEILDTKWNKFSKTIQDSPAGNLGYYSNLLGFDPSKLTDPIAFEDAAKNIMESNFYYSHGDIEGSKNVLIRDLGQNWGDSYANGFHQITYFPPEKALNLPSNEPEIQESSNPLFSMYKVKNLKLSGFKPFSAVGLMQDDIIENVSSQLEPINKSYKEGKSLYHFEIEPRPSIDWAKNNRYTSEVGHEHEDRLETYSNGSPIVIHRVWKNGNRETYNLMVKASPTLTQLSNGSDYKGAWSVIAVSKTGGFTPLGSLTPILNQDIYYKPDSEKIRSLYLKHYGELNGR